MKTSGKTNKRKSRGNPSTARSIKSVKRRSLGKEMKINSWSKDVIDKLTAFVAETRDLQNKYYAELMLLLTRRKKATATATREEAAALLEIMKIGPGVFGSKVHFSRWLNNASIPLGRETPLKLMLLGRAELVRDALLRVEYGVYA